MSSIDRNRSTRNESEPLEDEAATRPLKKSKRDDDTSSLQTLSARAAMRFFTQGLTQIPEEENELVKDLRRKLQEELKELENETQERITKRMMELYKARNSALEEHFRPLGFDFCNKCNDFFQCREDSTNTCSVEGCESHKICPKCVWESDCKRRDLTVDDDNFKRKVYVNYEQEDWPSKTGYVECWICKKSFCNADFRNHYKECRKLATKRCGFRQPTLENGNQKYACVPGHCGEIIEGSVYMCGATGLDGDNNEGYAYYCEPGEDIDICTTICCKNCADFCENQRVDVDDIGHAYERICNQVRCKLCVGGRCPGNCWTNYT